MLGNRRWLALTVVAALVTMGFGISASAEPTTEAQFVAEINASRAANGLPPLKVDGKLASYADTHTAAMIEAGTIFHSTGEQLASAGSPGWTKLGENVGAGGTPASLHDAFMKSPGHRANILAPDFNYVGVGTGFNSDDVMYVTVIFMALPGSETTTTKPPTTTSTTKAPTTTSTTKAPTTTAAPEQTSTTTTTAPTTTTTLEVGPDHPVVPGESCLSATRFWWMCHD